jgi:hypothetical protein
MGCGCKNKTNGAAQPVQSTQELQQLKIENSRKINEDVKSAIKKTIEKYYNQGKTK